MVECVVVERSSKETSRQLDRGCTYISAEGRAILMGTILNRYWG